MKFEMTKIAVVLAFTFATTGAQAAVVGPTNMQITGGAYGNGFPFEPVVYPLSIIGTNDITDQYNLPGWDTAMSLPVGVLAPGASLSFDYGPNSVAQNGFFAPSAVGAGGGGAAPVFNGLLIDGNVSSIDMRSFFVNWGSNTWNQGNAALPSNGNNPLVTNLTMSGCVGLSCNWTMSWKSLANDGPWRGNTGIWELSGTITAVPEASTYGMMLSGLGLVGLAIQRRRKQGKV